MNISKNYGEYTISELQNMALDKNIPITIWWFFNKRKLYNLVIEKPAKPKKLTVSILKDMAQRKGLKGCSKLRKRELIALVFDIPIEPEPEIKNDSFHTEMRKYTVKQLKEIAHSKGMRAYKGLKKKDLFKLVFEDKTIKQDTSDNSEYYTTNVEIYGKIITDMFNQVGMIINEYVPEHYNSGIFRKDHVISVYNKTRIRAYHKCSSFFSEIATKHVNVKVIVAPKISKGDISPLTLCKNIHTLCLGSFRDDIGPLLEMKNLHTLGLGLYGGDCQMSNYITQLTNLKVLKLPCLISRATFLNALVNLEELYMPKYVCTNEIINLPKLRVLDLSRFINGRDKLPDFVVKLRNLEYLNIKRFKGRITCLRDCAKLKCLVRHKWARWDGFFDVNRLVQNKFDFTFEL